MKLSRWIAVPTLAAMSLATVGTFAGHAQMVQVQPKFQPNPLTLSQGVSGGTGSTACGNIAASPNVVVTMSEDISAMSFTVQSAGQPTLLIEGPNGQSCVFADKLSGGKIEVPGYWEKGNYSIYVGDRAGESHNYTLSVIRAN